MTTSDDEYDKLSGGPVELTEEDANRIDTISEAYYRKFLKPSISHIDVALEDDQAASIVTPPDPLPPLTILPKSPYRLYRASGIYVTDLTAPTWCEVQFEYGLYGQKWKKIEVRPQTFQTRKGKTIDVVQKAAIATDNILKKGTAVHLKLERELHAPPKFVITNTREDKLGLRLLNMLSYIESLLTTGKCREFPVMGFIQEQYVTGTIDEIYLQPISSESFTPAPQKRPVPSTPSRRLVKRSRADDYATSSTKQSTMDNFVSAIPDKERTVDSQVLVGNDTCPRKTHSLHLVDNKTREAPSLPEDSTTFGSKIQLMIYKKLLDNLLSLAPLFDFDRLWRQLQLNPRMSFSPAFLEELSSEIGAEDIPMCLKDFEDRWTAAVRLLNVTGVVNGSSASKDPVDSRLTLVYRLRSKESEKKKRKGMQQTIFQYLRTTTEAALTEERTGFEKLVTEVKVVAGNPEQTPVVNASVPPTISEEQGTSTGESTTSKTGSESKSDVDSNLTRLEKNGVKVGEIIGQIQFEHDDTILKDHVRNILEWWYGHREPIGVSEENAGRCQTCEYIMGCEWREAKAREISENIIATVPQAK
ncbi:hypothetical protein M422DRAFT_64540 [Sphaerobolus stellatus SS14]|nr:hypothetical protein M422DRAFT_64540 [Sphaerobolus stellatus SS14]